jgi:hypothetical protein
VSHRRAKKIITQGTGYFGNKSGNRPLLDFKAVSPIFERKKRMRETAGGVATRFCSRTTPRGLAPPVPEQSSEYPKAGAFPSGDWMSWPVRTHLLLERYRLDRTHGCHEPSV